MSVAHIARDAFQGARLFIGTVFASTNLEDKRVTVGFTVQCRLPMETQRIIPILGHIEQLLRRRFTVEIVHFDILLSCFAAYNIGKLFLMGVWSGFWCLGTRS
jgi:hypothetical protein